MDTVKPYMYHVVNDLSFVTGHKKECVDRVKDTYTGPIKGMDEPVTRPAGSWKLRRGSVRLSTLSKQYPEFGYLLACSMLPGGATLASARSIFQVVGINKLREKIHEVVEH